MKVEGNVKIYFPPVIRGPYLMDYLPEYVGVEAMEKEHKKMFGKITQEKLSPGGEHTASNP